MSKKGSGKGRLSQKTYNNLRQKKADISKENDTLARETMKMAGRLEALRNYLAEEKKNRSLLPGGTRWGGARKVQGDYMKVVMNRITKKVEADLINKKKRRAKNKDFARKQSTNTNPTIRPGSSYASPIQSTRDKGKGLLARLLEDFPAVVRKEMDIFSDEDAILLTREDLMDICGKAQGIRLFRRLHPPRKSPEPSPELRDVRPEPIISPKPGQVSADPKPESKHSPRNPQALGSQRGEGLLDGHFDEKGGHEEFLKAREAFLREISDGAGSLGVPQKSPKNELLLEGKFDEKSGHEEFLKAREEFLAGLKGGSTPILRELEEPPVDAENLLEGKFDERRNHSEFLQARKMFLTEAGLHDLSDSKADSNFSLPARTTDMDCWKPPGTIGGEGLLSVLGIDTCPPAISDEPKKSEICAKIADARTGERGKKTSCYHCYKLFYEEKGVTDTYGHKFCGDICLDLEAHEVRKREKVRENVTVTSMNIGINKEPCAKRSSENQSSTEKSRSGPEVEMPDSDDD